MTSLPLNPPNSSVPAVPVPVVIVLAIVAFLGFSGFAYILVNGNENAAGLGQLKRVHQFAERGDVEAQFWLGTCYYDGTGVRQSHREAVKWFRKAAEQGYAEAQCTLGVCYLNSEGVPEDKTEAVRWFRMAAEQGNAHAQFWLGACYCNGVGVNEDKTEGVKWLRKAVEQGQEKAIDFLRQIDRAANEISTLHTKAERGDVEAQILLIDYYSDGIAVPPNYEEALKWLRKAAEQGNAHAQYLLGAVYYRGEYVSQNYAEAVQWFHRAATQGHVEAKALLGDCYCSGFGVSKNDTEAMRWYREAAEQGHANAQVSLGVFYFNGVGVRENKTEAVKWFRKAAEQGHENAIDFLRKIESGNIGSPSTAIDAGSAERAAHLRVLDAYRQAGEDFLSVNTTSREEHVRVFRSFRSNLSSISLHGCSSEFRSDFIALINSVAQFIAATEHLLAEDEHADAEIKHFTNALGKSLPDNLVEGIFIGVVNTLGGEMDGGASRMQKELNQDRQRLDNAYLGRSQRINDARQRLRNAGEEWRRAETALKKYE